MGTYIRSVSPWEANLASRIQSREEGAFQELFHTFRDKVYRTAFKILREEESAKDALQETFLNIYRAAKTFRGDSKLGTWINRITVNVCLEMIRRNRKHRQRVEEDISENLVLADEQNRSPFEETYLVETQELIHAALDRVAEKRQKVVRLHDLEGFTIREIAELLGIAEGTVKSRLFYGREELKKRLIN